MISLVTTVIHHKYIGKDYTTTHTHIFVNNLYEILNYNALGVCEFPNSQVSTAKHVITNNIMENGLFMNPKF